MEVENPIEMTPRVQNERRRPVAPLACTYCRYKHLRCDGKSPTCSRCRADGRECQYLKSRRGYRGVKQGLNHPSKSNRGERLATAPNGRVNENSEQHSMSLHENEDGGSLPVL